MTKNYIELRNLFLSFDPNKDKQELKTEEIEYTEFTEIEEDDVPLAI